MIEIATRCDALSQIHNSCYMTPLCGPILPLGAKKIIFLAQRRAKVAAKTTAS